MTTLTKLAKTWLHYTNIITSEEVYIPAEWQGLRNSSIQLVSSISKRMFTLLRPFCTTPDYIEASRFSYVIRLLFTLRHCNPVRVVLGNKFGTPRCKTFE